MNSNKFLAIMCLWVSMAHAAGFYEPLDVRPWYHVEFIGWDRFQVSLLAMGGAFVLSREDKKK